MRRQGGWRRAARFCGPTKPKRKGSAQPCSYPLRRSPLAVGLVIRSDFWLSHAYMHRSYSIRFKDTRGGRRSSAGDSAGTHTQRIVVTETLTIR